MSQCDWVNKPALAAAFSRAAHSYDGAAAFQRRCGERLLALLPAEGLGRKALDAGCGTGYFSRRLTAMDYRATALDLARGCWRRRDRSTVHAIICWRIWSICRSLRAVSISAFAIWPFSGALRCPGRCLS